MILHRLSRTGPYVARCKERALGNLGSFVFGRRPGAILQFWEFVRISLCEPMHERMWRVLTSPQTAIILIPADPSRESLAQVEISRASTLGHVSENSFAQRGEPAKHSTQAGMSRRGRHADGEDIPRTGLAFSGQIHVCHSFVEVDKKRTRAEICAVENKRCVALFGRGLTG